MLKSLLKSLVRASSFWVPSRPMLREPKRILLLMCNYLGDTLWAVQAAAIAKRRWPDAEIWAAVKPQSSAILPGFVREDRVLLLSNVLSDRTREPFSLPGFLEELKEVRALRFDIVLDLTFNRFSAIFSRLSGARFIAGCEDADEFGSLYDLSVSSSLYAGRHLALRPLALAHALAGSSFNPDELPVPAPPAVKVPATEILSSLSLPASAKIALLLPGAGWESKRWPAERFAEAALALERAGFHVVAAGAPHDEALCRKAIASLKGGGVFIRPFEDFVSLLPLCSVAVSNDSGPGHLAAAFGVRLAAVFCSSSVEFGRPLGRSVFCFRPECPLAPKPGVQHCGIFPSTCCGRAQWMSVSAKDVVAALLSKGS